MSEKARGLLIVVSGPSGVGKGSICRALEQRHADVCYAVSATTRQPRAGETDGVAYYFISEEEFLRRRFTGADSGLTTATTRPAETLLP